MDPPAPISRYRAVHGCIVQLPRIATSECRLTVANVNRQIE